MWTFEVNCVNINWHLQACLSQGEIIGKNFKLGLFIGFFEWHPYAYQEKDFTTCQIPKRNGTDRTIR